MLEEYILFNKVKSPYGWLGNMSPHSIKFDKWIFPTAEHAFQSLRIGFNHPVVSETIKNKSPMNAKLIIKSFSNDFIVEPLSEDDLLNMSIVVYKKFQQHSDLKQMLKDTGNSILVEDVSNRKTKGASMVWGGYLENGKLIGENKLGQILMRVRENI